ncbi:MAG: caspase family protein [Xanthobacteraceae bacterium]
MGLAGLRSLFIAGISLLAMSVDALADKRVALVVGNSAYQNVAKLPNPSSDAAAIADLLKKSGFSDVALLQDAGNLEFKRAIRRFEDMARDADVAVVFYAGHGIEIGGTNYMIPVDAKLASDLDAQDEAITLDRIVESVDSAKQLSLVILDACRDNPFVASMKRQRQAALRSVSAGLGKVEPTSSGTLIAYAAKAGSTADDGVSDHSPFTTAILKFIALPGLDIRLALGQVRDEVMKMTNQRQEPYVYGSLGGATVPLVSAPQVAAAPPVATSSASDANADARRDFENSDRVGTKEAWDAFLALHSTGLYADLARAQRAKLMGDSTVRSSDTRPAQSAPVVAAVSPPSQPNPPPAAGPAPGEVTRMLQTELVRVGCYSGAINGEWNTPSRRALDAFNRNERTKLDQKAPTLESVNAVREKQTRVCPLVCDKGSHAEGDTCVKIACETGYAPDDKGNCVQSKGQPQTTTRTPAQEQPAKRQAPVSAQQAGSSAKSSGGQSVACDRFGCRTVGKGCHVETSVFREETQQTVVCR